jgi:hypothetical protein
MAEPKPPVLGYVLILLVVVAAVSTFQGPKVPAEEAAKVEQLADVECLPERLREAANADSSQEPFCSDGRPTEAARKLGFVSRAQFESAGEKWPLSVDAGFVGCTGTGARWFETRNGQRFGLNGLASSRNGYEDIKPIWLENKEFNERMTVENGGSPTTTIRISIFDLSQAAAAHCP